MKRCFEAVCGFLLGFALLHANTAIGAGTVTTPSESALTNAMAGGGTVNILCGGTITLSSPITVSSDTELVNAGGAVISGGGTTRLFMVSSGTTFAGYRLYLANGSNSMGGAIYNSGYLILNDCVLSNNVARGNAGANGSTGNPGGNGAGAGGGAICNDGMDACLNRCVFATNRAYAGNGGSGGNGGSTTHGGNGAQCLGGAVYGKNGTLYITNCLFRQNAAYGGNGGIGGGSTQTGDGGVGEIAAGGAVYASAGCTITGSTFDRNIARSGNSAIGGSSSTTGHTGSNGPYGFGGGIWANGLSELKNCTFFQNLAVAGNGGKGGTGEMVPGAGGNGGYAFGGNLYNTALGYDSTSLMNCTFAGGAAYPGTNGGVGSGPTNDISAGIMGLSCGDNISTYSGDTLVLDNCILASPVVSNNAYSYINSILENGGYSLSSDNTPSSFGADKRNKSDLWLGALGNNGGDTPTIPLSAGSCAIDVGNSNVANIRDQRGLCASGTRDVGAYEVNGFAPSKVCIVAEKPFASKTNDAGRFLICRYDDASSDLTVNYSIGGSANNGTHYATIPSAVTIPAGQFWARVNITPLVNTNKTVTLTLAAGGYFDLYGPSTATVTISNQPQPFDPHDTRVTSGGRFVRGGGTDPNLQSFVIPLDFQKGFPISPIGGTITNFLPGLPLENVVFHYDAEEQISLIDVSSRIPCQNPLAAFGSSVGGSALYVNQPTRFGIYAGMLAQADISNAVKIVAFRNTGAGFTKVGQGFLPLPSPLQTNAWQAFLTNGSTVISTNLGLITSAAYQADFSQWGCSNVGCLTLTHTATTNYVYQISVLGGIRPLFFGIDPGCLFPLAGDADLEFSYSPLYLASFEYRPANRSVFVDAPQFDGEPLPPGYQSKTLDELTACLGMAMSTVTLPYPANTYTNLDASPELRRHPILDQFVKDMGRDPIALARYVHNEIKLSDAIDLDETGNFTNTAVNLGGVSRGALGVYLEGQGSPAEQCALLVYLLRQAGMPAVYCFPPHNELKLIETHLSRLLRIQVRGAVNYNGEVYTTNKLIAANYPWVAAYDGTNWVHLFPWLKDTQVIEGFDLNDFMPRNYDNGFKWAREYAMGNTNLLSLATDDDTPLAIWPKFIQNVLTTNAPGISIDDVGMQWMDRPGGYARWSDFPRPFVVPSTNTALDSLSSPSITNVFAGLTNIFDTFSVEVGSVTNSGKKVVSGEMRMLDVHNRRFLIRHDTNGPNAHSLILNLAAFRTGVSGTTNFTLGSDLLNSQQVSTPLDASDDTLKVRMVYKRHRALPETIVTNMPKHWDSFLGVSGWQNWTNEMSIRKGDIAAICMHVGRVSQSMLNVHAQELWNMERMLALDTNSIADPNVYQGGTVYLMGMAYFENLARFADLNQRLNKVRILSGFGGGLAKLSAKRVNGLLPNNGEITLVQPGVDMSTASAQLVNNITTRADSGEGEILAPRDYRALGIVHGSAEEHQIINRFFGQSNAISTVKLLHRAQARLGGATTGPLTLTKQNFPAQGNVIYNGLALKNHDPSLWSQVTNHLGSNSGNDNWNNIGWITPGSLTNSTGTYRGMGALLFSLYGSVSALISPNNMNGGCGDKMPDNSFIPANAGNYTLAVAPNGDFYVTTTEVNANNKIVAPDAVAAFNLGEFLDNAQNNYLVTTPISDIITRQMTLSDLINPSGSACQQYGLAVEAQDDSGWAGALSFVGKVWDKIADPVSAVTGEFYHDATDLTLPGPMPISLRRNYSSHNLANNQFGYGWKMNYLPFLSVSDDNLLIYAAEMDGSVLAYEQQGGTNVWQVTPARNPLLDNLSTGGAGSTANRFRNRIVKTTGASNDTYALFGSDGSIRTYQTAPYSGFSDNKPYLMRWRDNRGNCLTFEYGTDSMQPDYREVRRILGSNGSILGLRYDVYGRIIEAYTVDGRTVKYDYDQFGDLTTVTLPDDNTIEFEYDHRTLMVTNGAAITRAMYSTHLITREIKPDGRVLMNQYDDQRRVTNQWATVGPDLRLVSNARFAFTNNFSQTNSPTNGITGSTTIYDVNNKPTVYRYASGQITNILDAANIANSQIWWQTSESNQPGYFPRSLKRMIDRRGLITDFLYDNKGNVTNSTVRGDLTGAGNTNEMAVTSTTYNTNSLPLETIDPVGNRTRTAYDAVFQWQPAQVTRLAGTTPVSSNVFVWYSVTNSLAGGGTAYATGLLQKEIRACGTPDAATNQWTHDGRGFVTQSTRRTGTTDPDVVLTLTHNGRGELIAQTDADGRMIEFTYDGLGRRQSREVYENGSRVAWDFTYYNGNGEPTWSDGPRYNPEDYVWRDYDGAGRVTQEIRWRSQAKADGTGVEAAPGYELYATTFQDWDAYNNLKRVTDPRGCVTTNVWDAIGRLIERRRLKTGGTVLVSEGFAYEPGGSVAFQTNALKSVTAKRYTGSGLLKFQSNPDGSTNTWQYYLDGRTRYEYLPNGNYWETVYDDANRRVTNFFKSGASVLAFRSSEFDRRGNLIRRVDEAGNAFTNVFDGLDRVKMTAGPVITNATGGVPGPGDSTPVQQITRYTYDASGRVLTVANAAGEKTITTSDALGRVVKVEVRDAGNALVSVTTTGYTPDHHGMTITNGTGASAITATSFTDTYGSPVLSIGQPASGTREFSLLTYDVAGNLLNTSRQVATNNTVLELWHTSAAYDELNRVTNRWDRDDALTRFAYDAAGNVTNRTLPGSLQWIGRYSAAGQLLLEYDVASGLYARSNTYAYHTNGSFAGLLKSHVDGRGVTNTLVYDGWMRPVTNTFAGILSEQKMSVAWSYDVRGLTTNISQSFAFSSNGPAVNVRRGFNAYGQLTSESIQLGGTNQSSASLGWNSSGRRSSLALNPPLSAFKNSFGYRADGVLASVSGDAGNANYTYDNGRLLVSRTVGLRVTSISERDGIGRPLDITTTVNGQSALSESLSWTGDGLLASQQLQRGDFTDQRSYSYSDLTRRLSSEQLKLDATRGWTNALAYDRGTSGGLGVLTKMSQGSALAWAATPDAFGRVQRETNSLARRNARGRINGTADVTATVDGKPLPVSVNGTNWSALMEVTAGAHKLETIAHHPSGQWNTNHAHWFTNRIGTLATTNIYDAAGNLTQRVWRRSNGQTNIVQTLTWDAMGRLATFTERTTNRNGFNWSAVYDPGGRRLRTVTASVTNNVVVSNQVTTINQYYDPSVEFLEAGFSVNNVATWKLYGPDGDGGYGSMQGVGGLEAVNECGTQRTFIGDSRGNVLAAFVDLQPAQINWNESRPTAYGYVPGCRPPTLGAGVSYAEAASWRGRVIDITGMSYLGMRHYEPGAGRWMSYDPVWNSADPNGYSFCGGDPVNRFDPTGRFGKGAAGAANSLVQGIGDLAANAYFSMSYGLTSLFYGNEQADQWFGQNWQGLKNTAVGTAQTVYDVGALGSYALTSPFNDELAYNSYGNSLQRLEDVGTALSGGENSSGAYRAGYTAFNVVTLLMGGEAGQAGRASKFGLASDAAEGTRALRLPATDASLTGTTTLGYTTPSGDVFLQSGLSRAEQVSTLRHESVHAFLSPSGSGPVTTFRQGLGQWGYDNSQLLRYSEETMAETYGSGSLLQGLRHPLVNGYGITPGGLLLEGGVVGGGLFGAGYLGYQLGGGGH